MLFHYNEGMSYFRMATAVPGFESPHILSNIFTTETEQAIFWLELVLQSTVMLTVYASSLK